MNSRGLDCTYESEDAPGVSMGSRLGGPKEKAQDRTLWRTQFGRGY
jgi:hypothetical protein